MLADAAHPHNVVVRPCSSTAGIGVWVEPGRHAAALGRGFCSTCSLSVHFHFVGDGPPPFPYLALPGLPFISCLFLAPSYPSRFSPSCSHFPNIHISACRLIFTSAKEPVLFTATPPNIHSLPS